MPITTELDTQLNDLIQILEARTPANPRSTANRKQMEALERKMQTYFRSLKTAFPYKDLERIYNKYVGG